MRRRSILHWFRTALVFLASLQAARAGSVEAQGLGAAHVERATAASAPREHAPPLGVRLPEIRPLSLRIQLAEPATSSEPRTASACDRSPAKPMSPAAPAQACVVSAWQYLGHAGESLAVVSKGQSLFTLEPGACRARAPNPVPAGN